MTDPLDALLFGLAGLVALLLILWPRKGIAARWGEFRRSSRRVQIEDALKHLYDCEYRKIVCTRLSLAGALSIRENETARLLTRLQSLGLVTPHGEGFELTNEGRSYALRVIRVHRLWERYLADETGIEETDWHQEAERVEHRLSASEADTLAELMGNPLFDPHGDPIPTSQGEIPGMRGRPLTSIAAGETVRIIHVEDEPQVVYAQIAALGLAPGQLLHILDSGTQSIRVESNGTEHFLAPLVASNVTVQPVEPYTPVRLPLESLASLKAGERGTVVRIARTCRGLQRRRLLDLGLVPGTVVQADLRSASGDPTAYRIRGASIALRKKQAEMIQIRRTEQ